jgi:hypothetical protein
MCGTFDAVSLQSCAVITRSILHKLQSSPANAVSAGSIHAIKASAGSSTLLTMQQTIATISGHELNPDGYIVHKYVNSTVTDVACS